MVMFWVNIYEYLIYFLLVHYTVLLIPQNNEPQCTNLLDIFVAECCSNLLCSWKWV